MATLPSISTSSMPYSHQRGHHGAGNSMYRSRRHDSTRTTQAIDPIPPPPRHTYPVLVRHIHAVPSPCHGRPIRSSCAVTTVTAATSAVTSRSRPRLHRDDHSADGGVQRRHQAQEALHSKRQPAPGPRPVRGPQLTHEGLGLRDAADQIADVHVADAHEGLTTSAATVEHGQRQRPRVGAVAGDVTQFHCAQEMARTKEGISFAENAHVPDGGRHQRKAKRRSH